MSYKILRFFKDDRPTRTIKAGLTLEEAKAHCQREDTHKATRRRSTDNGEDYLDVEWFDGFTKED